MEVATPPIDGYGELARRVLAHPEWPADTQPRARSLAALFSKLDRRIELEWLGDRDAAQRALALVLGCPLETVRRAVAPEAETAPGRIRFFDLPYARPFDLRDEPLPPGIPELVRNPASWERVWWRAPSGSGRSLTGQWLRARGLARFVSARRLEDVLGRLGGSGPMFLELELLDAPELLAQLGLSVGDEILIGSSRFTIRGVIATEPGRSLSAFTLGPRVMIDYADLEGTGLLTFGSRVVRQMLLRIPEPEIDALTTSLQTILRPQFVRVRSFRDRQEQIGGGGGRGRIFGHGNLLSPTVGPGGVSLLV